MKTKKNVKKVSASGSLEGYEFSKWASGMKSLKNWLGSTKNTFKTVVVAGLAIGGYFLIPVSTAPVLLGLYETAWVGFGKWLLDGIDYWLSDIKLE